jgi:hypothetical protein
VTDADAASFMAAQVHNNAATLCVNLLHRCSKLWAAVATLATKYVAGEALTVHSSEHRLAVINSALNKGKMLDVEYTLLTDSMDALDDCEDGDFREEGFRKFEWKACAYKLEMSDGAGDALAQQVMGMLAGFQLPGAAAGAGDYPMAAVGGGGLGASVQMAMGALPTFLQLLEDKIRKVRVEVTWKDAVGDRSIVLERFVTTLGEDRTGNVPKDGEAAPDPSELLNQAVQNLPGGNPAATQRGEKTK